MLENLELLLADAGINVSDQQKQQLVNYVSLLCKWNKTYNLTAVRCPQQMLVRHILDSIVVNEHLSGERFIDAGTGPGLPGIPLAIVRPDSHFTLLDSLGKRVRFLRQAQHELGLKNVLPVQSRVEDYSANPLFDGIISRAFSSLQDMVARCYPLLARPQGRFYALKGVSPDEELSLLPEKIKLDRITELYVPGLHAQRHLIVLKLAGTADILPFSPPDFI